MANGATYYIDTTVPEDKQASRSVFEENKKYNFFLIYPKSSTDVTFQLYVGKGLTDDDIKSRVKMVRMGKSHTEDGFVVLGTPIESIEENPTWNKDWGWGKKPDYDPGTGILTVRMNYTAQSAFDFVKAASEACGPPSDCQWNGTQCVAADKPTSPIDYRVGDNVCQWSVKALECPSGGCPGFQVEFPPGFLADGSNPRPDPKPFPPTWSVPWKLVDEETAGMGTPCYYEAQPEPYIPPDPGKPVCP